MIKFGLADLSAERTPIKVLLLDDDSRRHRWFIKRFKGDELDLAENVQEAKDLLAENTYDAIFLDHDLLPHHYDSNDHDPARSRDEEVCPVRPGDSARRTPPGFAA